MNFALLRTVAAGAAVASGLVSLSALAQVTPGDPGAVASPRPAPAPAAAPVTPATPPSTTSSASAPARLTPIGLWQTIDDKTGKPRSLVRISDSGQGVLIGRIEKVLNATVAVPVCEKCDGDQKNRPIEGLQILSGLKPYDGYWADGRILNPEDGKTYNVKATPVDGGRKLEMRGYIGLPVFGRTQTWIREP